MERKENVPVFFTYHVVISRATMKSSLRMRAVNEMDTMCRNSFSKRTRDMIIIVAPRWVI